MDDRPAQPWNENLTDQPKIFRKTTAGKPGGGFLFSTSRLPAVEQPKNNQPNQTANLNPIEPNNSNALPFGAANNNPGEPNLERLREIYLGAGLPPTNALEAAIADFAQLFSSAA